MKPLRKNRLNLAIIILSVFLIGCGVGVKNVAKDYYLDDTKGKGLIIISLTKSGISKFSVIAQMIGVDNNKYMADVPVTGLVASSDFSSAPLLGEIPENKPCGRLAVIELPQGEYEFYSWYGSGGHIRVQATTFFSKRFKAVAGRAVYIGNMHFSIHENSYNVKTNDMSSRDLPLLYKKFPNITQDKVTVNILQ